MSRDERTYVIDSDTIDPDLIRSIVPLGEDDAPPTPRKTARRRRARVDPPEIVEERLPRRPALLLTGAYLAGPAAVFFDRRLRRRRGAWIAAAAAVMTAAAAALIWTLPTESSGDRSLALQMGAAFAALAVWIPVWSVGMVRAYRRCGEGPLARRGARRPLLAAVAGFLAPGLGLLLAGRIRRALVTVTLVGLGMIAGLGLWRAPTWWAQQRETTIHLITDLQMEKIFLGLGLAALVGGLAWLVSALEAGRVATGSVVVRRMAGADRVPALLLLALVAFGFLFRPDGLAGAMDRLTGQLVAADLRLIPMWTARAATVLDPAEPVYEIHLAARYEDLGHLDAAVATRQRLARRWDRYRASNPAVTDLPAKTPVTIWAPTTVSIPRPFASAGTTFEPDRPKPAP